MELVDCKHYGDCLARDCKECTAASDARKRERRNRLRRERDQAMRDHGMVKVRGNLGTTYWE